MIKTGPTPTEGNDGPPDCRLLEGGQTENSINATEGNGQLHHTITPRFDAFKAALALKQGGAASRSAA